MVGHQLRLAHKIDTHKGDVSDKPLLKNSVQLLDLHCWVVTIAMRIREDAQAVSPVSCSTMLSLVVEERVGVVGLHTKSVTGASSLVKTHVDFVDLNVDIIRHKDLTSVDHVLGVKRVVCVGRPVSVSANMTRVVRSVLLDHVRLDVHVGRTSSVAV